MANEKQRKTFLSYSRVNTDFAKKLAKELKAEGFPVWLDQLDIPAGSRWDREVEKALRECEIFMIIMTPASIDSENVLDEIGYAIDTGKRLLPVLLENCEVPFRLRRFQYVDFTNKDFEGGVESAKQLLRGLIAQTTIPRGQVPDDTQAQKKKAELDRKAEEDAERIAKKVADEELAAKTKVETERKEKKEADRLAAQKAEVDKLAKQNAEDDRLAQVKAETEREAEEKVVPLDARMQPKISATNQKKPTSRRLVIGIVALVVLVIAGIGFSALSKKGSNNLALSDFASQIADRGSIRIGVRSDTLWPFTIYDGSYSGFEIDLAREIVQRLFGSQVSIEWLPLTASERFSALQSGDIDLLIRNTSHTISREENGLWTSNYFLDGMRLLVYRDSGVRSINDLDGGMISVPLGTTYELALNSAATAAGIEFSPLAFDGTEAYSAFFSGQADATTSDWSQLLNLTQGDPAYQIVGELLSREPFGIGIPPNNQDFRDEVDAVLLEIIADGTWLRIYDRWFPDPPPWTLEELLAEPPVNR